jgi:hypothetical protein
LLRNLSAKAARECIFKPKTEKEALHEIRNDIEDRDILPSQNVRLSRMQCFHIAAFINAFGLLVTEKHDQYIHTLKDERKHSSVFSPTFQRS